MKNLTVLYEARFTESDRIAKDRVWRVLCRHFFQGWISRSDVVLDLACGIGEFSRHIKARRKIAVDINPAAVRDLPGDVEFFAASADKLDPLGDSSVDVVFVSNFFEHLPDKTAMDQVLSEILRVLRAGGRLMMLQPNIKYSADRYWDFYDHILPLSHLSASEGLVKNGYVVQKMIPRFLPWSFKTRLPRHPFFVWLYLKSPAAWRVLGRQFFILARKPSR